MLYTLPDLNIIREISSKNLHLQSKTVAASFHLRSNCFIDALVKIVTINEKGV